MKQKRDQNERIRGKIATALDAAVRQHPSGVDDAARLLEVEPGTLYKYMNGDMIPGGQVLWRACEHFGLVLDREGLHPSRGRRYRKAALDDPQYRLPFLNESVDGKKVNCHVRRSDNQYVQVNLRIKLAG